MKTKSQVKYTKSSQKRIKPTRSEWYWLENPPKTRLSVKNFYSMCGTAADIHSVGPARTAMVYFLHTAKLNSWTKPTLSSDTLLELLRKTWSMSMLRTIHLIFSCTNNMKKRETISIFFVCLCWNPLASLQRVEWHTVFLFQLITFQTL